MGCLLHRGLGELDFLARRFDLFFQVLRVVGGVGDRFAQTVKLILERFTQGVMGGDLGNDFLVCLIGGGEFVAWALLLLGELGEMDVSPGQGSQF